MLEKLKYFLSILVTLIHTLLKAPFYAWETTNEKHAEFYMPWQLLLTILKAKENKQVL